MDGPVPFELMISILAEHYHKLPEEILEADADLTMRYYRISNIFQKWATKKARLHSGSRGRRGR